MGFVPCSRGQECQYTVTGLLPGHSYSFSLTACLGEVCGKTSPIHSLTTPPERPSQPAPPRIATRSKTAVTLRWTAPADNGAVIDQYCLEWDQVCSCVVYSYDTCTCTCRMPEIYTVCTMYTTAQYNYPTLIMITVW